MNMELRMVRDAVAPTKMPSNRNAATPVTGISRIHGRYGDDEYPEKIGAGGVDDVFLVAKYQQEFVAPQRIKAGKKEGDSKSPQQQVAYRLHQRLPIVGTYVAAYERFAGIGKTVHDVAEKHEELHEQSVDSQHLVADSARFRSDEGEDCCQTNGAKENVAVHFEELPHGMPLQGLAYESGREVTAE